MSAATTHIVVSEPFSVGSPTYDNDLAAGSGDVAFRLRQEYMKSFPTPAAFRVAFEVTPFGDNQRVVIGTATNNLDAPGIHVMVR